MLLLLLLAGLDGGAWLRKGWGPGRAQQVSEQPWRCEDLGWSVWDSGAVTASHHVGAEPDRRTRRVCCKKDREADGVMMK